MKAETPTPPALALRFFRWYCHPRMVGYIEGDLMEVYVQRLQQHGKRKANFRFIIDVLLLCRPGIIRPATPYQNQNSFDMFKNYFSVMLRVFNKEKLYSTINILGLALGFTSCLMIYLFIRDELSYDKFHPDADRIYRVSAAYMRQGVWEPYATNAWKTAELLRTNFSDIEKMVRISTNQALFEYGDKRIFEQNMAWVDDTFFEVFNFPLVKGNPADALKGSDKVVISESTAKKYFGTDDPLGKVFTFNDGAQQLQVSGVMRDMPSNAHFHLDILVAGENLRQVAPPALFTNVGWDSQYVYIKAGPGFDPARMEAAFPDFINGNLDFWTTESFKLFLQPLLSIHLHSNIGLELEPNGSINQVYIFSAIALFVLVIACINYMNLTTAKAARRAKEVGMRKALGARKSDLVSQFLSESMIMTLLAMSIAFVLALLLLPEFNQFAGKQIDTRILFSSEILLSLLGASLAIGLLSGVYPSFIMSSFRPANNAKGIAVSGNAGVMLRKGLVVLQFVISIGLIAASAIAFQQWNFLKNKDVGYNKETLLSIPLQTMDLNLVNTFKNELLASGSVKKVGFSDMQMPGWISHSTGYTAQDVEQDAEVNKSMKIIRIDADFLSTIETQLLAGRDLLPAADTSSIILNESAVEQLGWKDPLGKWMEVGEKRYFVVGLLKDFHFETLYRKIPPIIFIPSVNQFSWAYVRVDQRDMEATLRHVERIYSKYVTNRDFTYTFVDDDIAKQYTAEQKFTEVFTLFTFLGIAIACLGTFGMISFNAERKSKEIGIRKVLGASVGNVSFLLVREFIVLLIVASCIAWPLTWYFLNAWMEKFVYRTTIGPVPFIIATLLAALIIILTTGFRALKAALVNPVYSLRDE